MHDEVLGFWFEKIEPQSWWAADPDFAAAKIAVLGASAVSALIGVMILWYAGRTASSRAGEKPS